MPELDKVVDGLRSRGFEVREATGGRFVVVRSQVSAFYLLNGEPVATDSWLDVELQRFNSPDDVCDEMC